MKNTIKKIYDNDYNLTQYYKEGWKCGVGEDDNVPMTLVVEVTNMHEVTGEDEYKDYPVVFTVGMLNKDIHESIDCGLAGGEERWLDDIISYYGMNCYLDDILFNLDTDNKKLRNTLTIDKVCISTYKNRFTGKPQQYLKFKTESDALEFAEKLINEYGDSIMAFVGFYLDRPINLMGETAWNQTELFNKGQ